MLSLVELTDTALASRIPFHVAIIMDGNGRWGTRHGLPRAAGHLRGIRAARRIVTQARELGLRHLTLFAFSTENWDRDPAEVGLIMRLLERYLVREAQPLAARGIRVRCIGEQLRLAPSLRAAISQAESVTADGDDMCLTLAISYGSQDEIVAAARRLAESCASGKLQPSQINPDTFADCLFIPDLPPVDLLIRTGGEQRLSNFLLWQSAYAELVFLPVLWPDFNGEGLRGCIEQYGKRTRRFGKL